MFFSCQKKKDLTLYTLETSTGINFTNRVIDTKTDNTILFRNYYNGGGVAIGDLNNDGLPDVVMTSNMGDNTVYLNKGNFKFQDITKGSGFRQDKMWSTGVVMVDINGDGWLDIYICNSGNMSNGNRRNKLYINNHDLTFTESAAKYGLDISAYSTQVSFFDYDGDGDLDCFVINNSPVPINQLNFSNRRDLPDSTLKIAKNLKGGGDHLYRNDNGVFKEVTRAAGIHGGLISFGLGVSVSDINNDGWPDIFVSNDSYERDYLYINQKDGTFKDEMENWFQHTSFSSMGADIADINNDGFPDLFTTDMLPGDNYRLRTMGAFDNISMFDAKVKSGFYYQYPKNCLQLNNGNGKFTDIARYSGVAATDWSWGALLFDMDNDGYNDLLVCNGINRDVTNLDFMDFFANDVLQNMALTGKKYELDKLLNAIPQTPIAKKVFRNEHQLNFKDVGNEWGFSQLNNSNGAAYGDLDNDGSLDLIVNNENQVASVYKNHSREINTNNYIAFNLKGTGKNTFAIGSRIQLFIGDQILTRELFPSRGFQSSVDYKLLFGLGKTTSIDSMIIRWPDRTQQTMIHPAINKIYRLDQTNLIIQTPGKTQTSLPQNAQKPQTAGKSQTSGKIQTAGKPLIPLPQTYFSPLTAHFDKHVENEYQDFYAERGIPRLLSKEGPKVAVGDLNGDGLADLYIGGARGTIGQVYMQTTDGSFIKKVEPAFQPFSSFEDVAVLFFDYDHDGTLDLLVCPGGNITPVNTFELQFRLFKNDGKGNFTLVNGAFPHNEMNISVAIANDVNGDGFPDLFIGSRSVPGNYGKDPQSYLFINDGTGHFTDIASTKIPALSHLGMVTGAVWADVLGNSSSSSKTKQLVIVGEWMTPHIFTITGNSGTENKTNLSNLSGWWQSIATADLNHTGRQDLILGNIGENFYLKPDAVNPVKLWLNDFDKNDDPDKIITYTYQGKDIPVLLKHDLEEQLPMIKKNNLKHQQYASKSIQELFTPELINSSTVKVFNYPSSCIAYNKGNGNFKLVKLPPESQFSCINEILPLDVNGDGKIDLVTGGNQFGFLPQFERLDGSFGDILINRGNDQFKPVKANKTGLSLKGEMRDIQTVNTKKGWVYIFLQNNEFPELYKLNSTR